ncbi:hypothetical protein PtrSN001A_010875, partial [Pyrenophora tritici-repentis]
MLPKIEELSLTDSLIRVIPAFHDSMMQDVDRGRGSWSPRHDSLTPTSGSTLVFQRFLAKITTLNVFPFNELLLRPPYLKFTDFSGLEHLAVPAISMASAISSPASSLPPSLKSLRLFVKRFEFVTQFTTRTWLADLVASRDEFPVLGCVQLYIKEKLAKSLGVGIRTQRSSFGILKDFETSSVSIEHYFLKPETETVHMNDYASSSRDRIDNKNLISYRQVCHKHG